MPHARLALLIVFSLFFLSTSVLAQTDSATVPFVRQVMYGVEAGYGSMQEQGSFTQGCGCPITGLTGGMLIGGLSAELPIHHLINVGLRAFMSYSQLSSREHRFDTAVVQNTMQQSDTITTIQSDQVASFSMMLLNLSPYFNLKLGDGLPFIRIGPSLAFIIGSHFKQTRELLSPTITLPDGRVVPYRFASTGTSSEVVEDRDLTDTKSIVFSAQFGAGCDIPLGSFTLAPMINYDLPLTTIRDTHAQNWKMSTIYGSLALKFSL